MNQNDVLFSQQFIVKFTSVLISIAMVSMIILNFTRQTYFTGVIASLAFVLTIIFFLIYQKSKNFNHWSNFFIAFVALFSIIVFYTGGSEGAGVLWAFLFPFFAIQFKRYHQGLILTAGFFFALLILYIVLLISQRDFYMPSAFMFVYFFILTFQLGYLYFYDRHKHGIQTTLAENTTKYKTLLNNLNLGVIMVSHELKIIEKNKTAETLFEDFNYRDICCFEMIQQRDTPCENCPAVVAFETGEVNTVVKRIQTSNGPRDFSIRAMPLFDQLNHVIAVMETFDDITEELIKTNHLIKEQKKFQTLSYIDGLTNVANRRSFDKHFETWFNQAKETKHYVAVLLIDIDVFKAYNDHYGHLLGDDILIKIGQTLNTILANENQFLARYGGEEFIAVLKVVAIKEIKRLAKTMHQAVIDLAIPHATSEVANIVTISVGVSYQLPNLNDHPNELIQAADKALYQAKEKGRNQVVYSHLSKTS